MKKNHEKIPSNIAGISGEYFVAAELSKRGYIASITLRNTNGVDILATNISALKTSAIQVKTNQSTRKTWILNEKAENYISPNHYYVFVNLNTSNGYPDFHIVPSSAVAKYVKTTHSKWLNTPGKNGQAHKDNKVRNFSDPENQYLNRWDLLNLDEKTKK